MVSFFGTEISPSSGTSSPAIRRNKVVLPDPFGPTRPTVSPGLSWKEASTKRSCRPYCLLTRVREIMRRLAHIGRLSARERTIEQLFNRSSTVGLERPRAGAGEMRMRDEGAVRRGQRLPLAGGPLQPAVLLLIEDVQ